MDDPNEQSSIKEAPSELALQDVTAEAHEPESEMDAEARQRHWFENVYQGDHVPQLTLRAVLMGGILGSLMSISNLYTMLKLGWGFGVAITAGVLSFIIWNSVRVVFRRISPMSILETNCMQSTASSAGYSTGSTIATAFGAHLLITGHQIGWEILAPWTLITALLGVCLAVPMKRQMINQEQLAFPGGIAAAETLRSLYSKSREAVQAAYALAAALVMGGIIGLLRTGDFAWQKASPLLKIPELLEINYRLKGGALPGLGLEPSVLLMGAGMIVGLRVSLSMMLGSALLYFVVAPQMVASGDIESPAKLLKWSLWTGTALMVTSGLTAFALQWKTIARSFAALKTSGDGAANKELAQMESIEVPFKWFLIGIVPLGICMVILEYVAFSIAIPLGILSIVMSFVLGLVACRSTGETDVTPIGAMGKITQLIYAALSPKNMVTNLMTASVTANTAIASADLLTDLKSGYLLGANPRKQFLAQLIGVFFGTISIVPAWYLMVPNKAVLEAMNPPNTNLWRAVAEALAVGIQAIPESARYGILIGGVIGIVLSVLEHSFPKARKYLPSAMGLGLSWIMVFSNSVSFLIGSLIATIWTKVNKKTADSFVVPIASGWIAGESLICAVIAMMAAYAAITVHK